MANKEHWSLQIKRAYEQKQRPAYDVLEAAVADLLAERQITIESLRDMARQMSEMVLARRAGDTDKLLGLLDGMFATHVTVVAEQTPSMH